jgi:hypothetical protein
MKHSSPLKYGMKKMMRFSSAKLEAYLLYTSPVNKRKTYESKR